MFSDALVTPTAAIFAPTASIVRPTAAQIEICEALGILNDSSAVPTASIVSS